MPVTTDDLYRALMSIDATLKELLALSKTKRAATPAPQMPAARQPLETVATEAELDSAHSDETIRFDPRDWPSTRSYKGCKMSECSPEYLDAVARAFTQMARDNDINGKEYKGVPQSRYDLRTAKRAAGWAVRLRAGWKPKEPEAMMSAEEVQW